MTIFHPTKNQSKTNVTHLNFMGGTSFDLSDPITRLRIAAASCFFGEPMYYHRDPADKRPARGKRYVRALSDADVRHLRDVLGGYDVYDPRTLTPSGLMEKAIDDALAHDPVATLVEAVKLRNESMIRTTPQVILVRAAHHHAVKGTGLVRKYAKEIIVRADEPAVGLAYQLHRYGKPVPNALKRAWRDALSRFSKYQLAKYRLETKSVKTIDVINLVHAKGPHVDALAKGTLTSRGSTWESILSERGSSKESWSAAVDVMGHMALLRNLRNLLGAEVAPKVFTDKLIAGVATGKQLPFRYYSAYRAVKAKGSSPAHKQVLDALETCLSTSIANLPAFAGRTMSLCDNSGSAQGATTSSMGTMQISTIANLTGLLVGARSEEGYLGVFGDRLLVSKVTDAPLLRQLEGAERLAHKVGGATENGIWLFWDKAIRKREHWDNVFVFSDMQAGHGGLFGTDPKKYADYKWNGGRHIDVPKLISAYKRKVNANVQVFLVQVAGYQDTIVPEVYDGTYILGGWSTGLLRYASEMTRLRNA